MNQGLHQQLAAKRHHLEIERQKAGSIHADPRDAHEAGVRAAGMIGQIGDLSQAVHTGEVVAEEIVKGMAKLNESPVKSGELVLCIRDLETAGFRLRQHLGTKIEPSKPTNQAG